jgi:hypothetical protein
LGPLTRTSAAFASLVPPAIELYILIRDAPLLGVSDDVEQRLLIRKRLAVWSFLSLVVVAAEGRNKLPKAKEICQR